MQQLLVIHKMYQTTGDYLTMLVCFQSYANLEVSLTTRLYAVSTCKECDENFLVTLGVQLAPQLGYEGGDDGDGGDVPDLVHLVAQLGIELDPKCDT